MPADLADEPDTPYLLIDDAVLRRNIDTLADWAAEQGLQVRPHAKTHKCAQVARRQLDAGAAGLSVATLGEAEAFAEAGFTELFIAYPLWLSPAKTARLRALAGRLPPHALRIGVDSAAGARQLARGLGEAAVDILVEVDSGMHRSGVAPAEAGAVAAAARDAGLTVIGVFTFPGHGYGPGDARESAAREEMASLAQAAESLRMHGIEPVVVSGGSSPTVALAARAGADDTLRPGAVLTEIRPGVYPFNDAQQLELGACHWPDLALVAVATVVSTVAGDRQSGPQLILDAGSKVLGADRPGWATGFGRLPDYPQARLTALSEHHATVRFPRGAVAPGLGEQVRVVPNHVCTAVNLADELLVETTGGRTRWPIIARGANR